MLMKLQTMLANPKTTHVAHALAAIPLPRVDKGREEISGGKGKKWQGNITNTLMTPIRTS